MAKLIKNGKSFMVIIPQDIVKRFAWDKRPELFVSTDAYQKRVIIEELTNAEKK